MKALLIAQKNLKEIFRNLKGNAILFLLPIAFIAIFGLVYGKSTDEITFDVAYVKDSNQVYQKFIEELDKVKNKDNDVFKLKEFDAFDTAKVGVEDRKQIGIIQWKEDSQTITFYGDTANSLFNAAGGVISNFATDFFHLPSEKVTLVNLNLMNKKDISPFQQLVPGLIVYAILLLIIQTAQTLTQVKEKKQIFRYFTSKTTSIDIILGYLLSMSVVALIQTLLLFLSAYVFGFRSEGNILFGFVVALIVSFFSVGVGLLIGAFVEKEEAAGGLGSLISLILGFFSGSFILGMENVISFGQIGDRTIRFVDFIPTFYATQAMKDVLLYGKGYSAVSSNLIVLATSTLIVLGLGIIVFSRRQLRNLE